MICPKLDDGHKISSFFIKEYGDSSPLIRSRIGSEIDEKMNDTHFSLSFLNFLCSLKSSNISTKYFLIFWNVSFFDSGTSSPVALEMFTKITSLRKSLSDLFVPFSRKIS